MNCIRLSWVSNLVEQLNAACEKFQELKMSELLAATLL